MHMIAFKQILLFGDHHENVSIYLLHYFVHSILGLFSICFFHYIVVAELDFLKVWELCGHRSK